MARDRGVFNIMELGAGDVQRRIRAGSNTVLIPIGSCERHGNPHTPLGLDGLVTSAVVEHAAQMAGVLHTPLMPFGYAPHHMGRPGEGCGTISFQAETYRRVLEDVGRSLIHHGFDKLVFVSFHSFNATNAEEVLFSLRFKTGAFAAFYGGRETPVARDILGSSDERLASDVEAAMLLALLGEELDVREYLSHSYEVHAPSWLGPAFSKRAGTGMSVSFEGAENITVGMDDFEFVRPVKREHPAPSAATREKGRELLRRLSEHLASFVEQVKAIEVEVRHRELPDRAR